MMKRIFFALSILYLFTVSPVDALTSKLYTQPATTPPKPQLPELYANEGKTFTRSDITVTVLPNTIPYDTYLTVQTVEKVHPIRIGKYWQVSNIYEIWLRSHFNSAKVKNTQKDSIVVIPYTDDSLKVLPYTNFPTEPLKVVCSPDGGATWTMERSSVVDSSVHTVSALTRIGGGCMLMTGFVPAGQYNNYQSVKGAFVENPDEMTALVKEDLSTAPLAMRIEKYVQRFIGLFYMEFLSFFQV